MARYFFNLFYGDTFIDTVGSEHPDLASVRDEATEFVAGRLQGSLLKTSNFIGYLLNVTDDAGRTVLILSLSATVQTIHPATVDR